MKKTNLDVDVEREIQRDPALKDEVAKANKAIDISMQIYTLRKHKKLTQKQLAKLIGISQSNVARLEDADYEGYTIQTLEKIASALSAELDIRLIPKEDDFSTNYWSVQTYGILSPVGRGEGGEIYIFKPQSNVQLNNLTTRVNNEYEKINFTFKTTNNNNDYNFPNILW